MIDEGLVLGALSTVRDPELDEPITKLGFVEDVNIDAERVSVRLRLPTYFCAPNFAFLMVADAKAAVEEAVAGAVDVGVCLSDHFASAEINHGVAGDEGFSGAFRSDAGGDLDDLRDLFRRKAFITRQERLYRSLTDLGFGRRRIAEMKIGDLPSCSERNEYLAGRSELGIDASPDAPFLVSPDGRPIPAEEQELHLRFARTVRVSIEGNAGFCRGLLGTRYGIAISSEEEAMA